MLSLTKFFKGKIPNDAEREFLQFNRRKLKKRGKRSGPIIINIDGNEIVLDDAAKLSRARFTLEKLIHIANLYRILYPIWSTILKSKNHQGLHRLYYEEIRPILSCGRQCFNNDLRKFHERWSVRDRYPHSGFIQRCPGIPGSGWGSGANH